MCRMIGIKRYRYEKHGDFLLALAELAGEGRVPEGAGPGHTDGWGVGYYRDGGAVLHRSAASILNEPDSLEEQMRRADGSPVVILHLRKSAWKGTTAVENSHPFLLRNRLFAHNGTIYNYRDLLGSIPDGGGLNKALDTEVFFHYVLGNCDGGERLRDCFNHVISTCSYSSLNCLMSDGKLLYAFREYTREPRYYSLYHAHSGGSDLVCSERVSRGLDWKMLGKRELLAL